MHAPFGPAQRAQQAAIHNILRSTGAQAKLTIGQPNDRYEQEADRVADQVMAMPDPKLQRQPENLEEEETLRTKPLADRITPLVQRQEEAPQEDEEIENAEEGELETLPDEEDQVLAKIDGNKHGSVSPSVESGIQSLRGGGQPLSASSRAYFEPRFGADFSGVRMHTDSNAAHLARSVNAKAFTIGKDLVFGVGQFAPETQSGKRLLAHELTHVVQQQARDNENQNRLLSNSSIHVQSAPAQSVQLSRKAMKRQKASIKRLYLILCRLVKRMYRTSRSKGFREARFWLRAIRYYINVWLLPERSSTLNVKIINLLKNAISTINACIELKIMASTLKPLGGVKLYLKQLWTKLLKFKFQPSPAEFAKAMSYISGYKKGSKGPTLPMIKKSTPLKYKKILKMIYRRMPSYSGSYLCGFDAWTYLARLMGIPAIGGIAPVIKGGKELKKRFSPVQRNWGILYELKRSLKGIRLINKEFDIFEKVGGKWVVRSRTDNSKPGYNENLPLKMFDLIRMRVGWGMWHYVVWLGGDDGWVIESINRKLMTIEHYKQSHSGKYIIVKKITRSKAIESSLP